MTKLVNGLPSDEGIPYITDYRYNKGFLGFARNDKRDLMSKNFSIDW